MKKIFNRFVETFQYQLKDFNEKFQNINITPLHIQQTPKVKVHTKKVGSVTERTRGGKPLTRYIQTKNTKKSENFTKSDQNKQIHKLDDLELYRLAIKEEIKATEKDQNFEANMVKRHNQIFYDEVAAQKAYDLTKKMQKQRNDLKKLKSEQKEKDFERLNSFLENFQEKLDNNIQYQQMVRHQEKRNQIEERHKRKVLLEYKQQKSQKFVKNLHQQYNIHYQDSQNNSRAHDISSVRYNDLQSHYSQMLNDISHDQQKVDHSSYQKIDHSGFLHDESFSKQNRKHDRVSSNDLKQNLILPRIMESDKKKPRYLKARIPSNHLGPNTGKDYEYVM